MSHKIQQNQFSKTYWFLVQQIIQWNMNSFKECIALRIGCLDANQKVVISYKLITISVKLTYIHFQTRQQVLVFKHTYS